MKETKKPIEVTPYSVSMGIIMAVIFSAAAAYLGLKVGQVFEAAIPIAILAVGITGALKKEVSYQIKYSCICCRIGTRCLSYR